MLSQETDQKQRDSAFKSSTSIRKLGLCCFVISIISLLFVRVDMIDSSNYYGNEFFYLVNLFLGYISLITGISGLLLAIIFVGVLRREK